MSDYYQRLRLIFLCRFMETVFFNTPYLKRITMFGQQNNFKDFKFLSGYAKD